MLYEMALHYERFYKDYFDQFSKTLLDMLIQARLIESADWIERFCLPSKVD